MSGEKIAIFAFQLTASRSLGDEQATTTYSTVVRTMRGEFSRRGKKDEEEEIKQATRTCLY